MNTARRNAGGNGITTSGLAYSGQISPGASTDTESWNGTNWTEVNNMNAGRIGLVGVGSTGNTAALAVGGETTPGADQASTEEWNGVSWVEVADLSTARAYLGGAGTTTAGIVMGGNTGSVSAATEEWSGTSTTTKTISTD